MPGDNTQSVAVVGMGMVAPGANSVPEFWDRLVSGEPAFSEPGERYRVADFHATDRSAVDRGYARSTGVIHEHDGVPETDFEVRWLRRALREAAATTTSRAGDRFGMFVGAWADGSQHLEESIAVSTAAREIGARTGMDPLEVWELLRPHYRFADPVLDRHLAHMVPRLATEGILPADTACLTVDTACASSLYAIDLGTHALLDGEVDIAYCGGVLSLGPRILVLFSKLGGLAPRGRVRCFDAEADGTLFSDGAALVALKRLDRALADGDKVLAVLAGFGAAADGKGKAIYAPNPVGQRLAIRRARAVNDITAKQVDLVIAHATGTPAGDGSELGVLAGVAGPRPLRCVSNKAVVGHTGWAAGVVSVIHAILCLRNDSVPAQPGVTALPAHCRDLPVTVPAEHTPLPGPARTVGVSAFGFGGTNGHLIIQDAPTASSGPIAAPPSADEDMVLVAWSAHLPGQPDRTLVAARLAAGSAPAEQACFGADYPSPPFHEARLPARTIRAVDRCQLMALSVAGRFAADSGPLWTNRVDRTAVIAAHTGPTLSSMQATSRCYAHGMARIFADTPHQDACADWLRALRDEVPPTSEDTQPGTMANIIASRIANLLDLHGPAMLTDAGPAGGLAALHMARGQLLRRTVDLALVLGVNGNPHPLIPRFGVVPAEGAFLLALARSSTANEQGWPVLARIDTRLRPRDDAAGEVCPVDGEPLDYGGATALIPLLRAVCTHAGPLRIHGTEHDPEVTVTPVRPRQAARWRHVLRPRSTPLVTLTAIPPGCLVLAGSAELANALADQVRRHDARLLCTDPTTAGSATVVPTVDDSSQLRGLVADTDHIRVFATTEGWDWPAVPTRPTVALRDLLFLATKHNNRRLAEGSVAIGLIDRNTRPHPHTALFTGFIKSLAWELPTARVHALITDSPDIDALVTNTAVVPADGVPVTRISDGVRHGPVLEPIEAAVGPAVLNPESTVLAIGGARGITAAAVAAIARRHRPRLWLVGSLDLDVFPADTLRMDPVVLRAGRADFIADHLRSGQGLSVAQINHRFERLLSANEAWHTLAQLRALCGDDRVDYLCCDITAPAATARMAKAVQSGHDRLDLLLNGAGLHRSGSVATKSLDWFRRVQQVKINGYVNLRAAFASSLPRRWCNFGSLAGFSGLPGETDYAAANELLAQSARWAPSAEFTIEWPQWAQTGIATRSFLPGSERAASFSSISNAEGEEHLFAELAADRDPENAVITVLGERDVNTIHRQFSTAADARPVLPYLRSPDSRTDAITVWTLTLDGADDPALRDHLVDGRPTLPGTFVLEIAAEAALQVLPGHHMCALRNAKFSAFLRTPADRAKDYTVRASLLPGTGELRTVRITVTSDVIHNGRILRADREHASVEVVLAPTAQPPALQPFAGTPEPVRQTDDPYYSPDFPVHLRGMYRNTVDCRTDFARARARWWVAPNLIPPAQRGAVLPALVLDALIRVLRLPGDMPPTAAVPDRIGEIHVNKSVSDYALAVEHPDGIILRADTATAGGTATTTSGDQIVTISGVRFAELDPTASVPAQVQSPTPESANASAATRN
ncbi:SDR family NAD(P)-dependent oxidoreductase [Actinosynnema sp. ALI-1.44]|uniref:SDR family NAD(P)-dependent oxidoreductase n=1 Tax=Actinosynnema sp. ALI-1.44 TaxID=1933779 RepID=UPI0011775B30|nr:SDR family NAD(P)-dependent oxidoreductase [Actinosynnema sp. ALI-1.44]